VLFRSVFKKLQKIIIENKTIIFLCPIVYYQIKRNLLYKNARKQLEIFYKLIKGMRWIEYEKQDWDIAVKLYLKLKTSGFSAEKQDADIFIAAQAFRIGAKVITNNLKDFQRLEIPCETWKG